MAIDFKWEIKLGDVLQLILILVALLGGVLTLQTWKTQAEDRINTLQQQQIGTESEHKELREMMESINTRRAHIEGKLDDSRPRK